VKLEHWLLILFAFLIGALGQIPRPYNQGPRHEEQSHTPAEQTQGNAVPADHLSHEGEQQNNQHTANTTFYNFTLTDALIAIFTLGLLVVAWRQADILNNQATVMSRQETLMDEIAKGQTADMRASIAEANRAARAMEGIAVSMATSVESVKKSVQVSREIADQQKLIGGLQSRAYLSVQFDHAIYQDAAHVFEAMAIVVNRGNTPAYDVTFKTAADILPYPTPHDFDFAIPAANIGTSVSMIASGLTKIIRRRVVDPVAEDQIEIIKSGTGTRILKMWGVINYRDAFNEQRYTNFAFNIYWAGKRPDGTDIIMSLDTAHHNESN
jgi:hypothetical protein